MGCGVFVLFLCCLQLDDIISRSFSVIFFSSFVSLSSRKVSRDTSFPSSSTMTYFLVMRPYIATLSPGATITDMDCVFGGMSNGSNTLSYISRGSPVLGSSLSLGYSLKFTSCGVSSGSNSSSYGRYNNCDSGQPVFSNSKRDAAEIFPAIKSALHSSMVMLLPSLQFVWKKCKVSSANSSFFYYFHSSFAFPLFLKKSL